MRNIFFMAAMLCGTVLSISCSKSGSTPNNPQPPLTNLNKISENTVPNSPYKVATYIATDSIVVGYNPFYITIKDTTKNSFVSNATVVLAPLMTDPTVIENGVPHHHSGPTEQPTYSDSAKAYKAAFIPLHAASFAYLPQGYKGWRMRIIVNVNGTQYDTVKYDFATKVAKTGTKFFTSVAGNDGSNYYLALVNPQQAKQTNGILPFEVAFYKTLDHSLTFQPVTDLTIDNFYPYMPDMGHSSPNNVTPKSLGNGHYVGAVNFTMGGHWTLNFLKIQQNGKQLIDSTALEVAF